MKKYISLLLLSFFVSVVNAEAWVSPIETKYMQKNKRLYIKYTEARELINNYRGQIEYLDRVDELLTSILTEDEQYAPAFREYGRYFILAGYINNNNFQKWGLNSSESSILKAIEIEPDYADAYVLLGHLYTNMRRFDDAEKSLQNIRGQSKNSINRVRVFEFSSPF
jgi:tetratricopeptide (TPR) repeat protein